MQSALYDIFVSQIERVRFLIRWLGVLYGNHDNVSPEYLEQKQFLLECMIILTFFSRCIKAGD